MITLNHTGVSHTVFQLLGIPGLEDQHMWISIPFFISYVINLLGNNLLIFIILMKRSLHEPMYLFLCMLAGADVVLSTCIVPQALGIFWFHAGEISLDRCVSQVFFYSTIFISESGILLVMAFDRYIAICYPLRYTTILTHALIGKIGVSIVLRSFCTMFSKELMVESHVVSLDMVALNRTAVSHTVFRLLGVPGLEAQHRWISIPFFISYFIALLGNSLLICIILTKRSLHEPMYLFLSMLSGMDIVLSTCIVPQALVIFWFHAGEISLDRCISQVFFLSSTFVYESRILLVMAFDCYIAICYPLRYTTILTHALIGKIGLILFLRSYGTVSPIIFLLKRLTFCKSNILPNTTCKHIVLARISCNDIRVNIWYGLFVLMSTLVIDVMLIFISYVLILHAVFRIPSRDARHKAVNTCGSHVCVISLFYAPAIFSVLTQRYGHQISPHIKVLLANVYILVPLMMNPIIYGIKTKQIWDQVIHVFFTKRA
ncbi:Olfactory receptor 52B4 [Galemys pyrenaicus]|uniref:Olfactory receptor 52B4 n=1 Tax=Galemys pyrenaicus TaxID=202257 RepID=A0A8J6AJM5_GALPY|nr:Olfactory receptor 52B4 [Galemys pyrenaicus]